VSGPSAPHVASHPVRASCALACLVLGGLILGACAGRLTVRSTLSVPPELALRVFPEVYLVADGDAASTSLARALATHLGTSPGLRVEMVGASQLRALLAAGRIGAAAAVVHVEAHLADSTVGGLVQRHEPVCGPWGCTYQRRTVLVDVPVVRARASLRVRTALGDRVLEQRTFTLEESGGDPLTLALRAQAQLERVATQTIDPALREVQVELLPSGQVPVTTALEALREGRVEVAVATLEGLVANDSFTDLSASDQATILFDLGQARRLSAAVAPDTDARRLDRAEEALRRAIMLRPEPTLALALEQLDAEREARRLAEAYAQAAAHNFSLAASAVPEPPSSYREGAPAP